MASGGGISGEQAGGPARFVSLHLFNGSAVLVAMWAAIAWIATLDHALIGTLVFLGACATCVGSS